MPEPTYVRVTDDVKPRREYTIVDSALVDGVHEVLTDKPATSADGTPLPPKYTPESLAGTTSDTEGDAATGDDSGTEDTTTQPTEPAQPKEPTGGTSGRKPNPTKET